MKWECNNKVLLFVYYFYQSLPLNPSPSVTSYQGCTPLPEEPMVQLGVVVSSWPTLRFLPFPFPTPFLELLLDIPHTPINSLQTSTVSPVSYTESPYASAASTGSSIDGDWIVSIHTQAAADGISEILRAVEWLIF